MLQHFKDVLKTAAVSAMVALPVSAQSPDTVRLSIGEAVSRAVRFGDEALLANAQLDVADAQMTSARASGLPQVRINSTFNHIYENARAQAVGQIFNQPNSYNTNANISQTVFQGGRIWAGMRAAARVREAAELNEKETTNRISFDVQRAYLQVLFASRLTEIQAVSYAKTEAHVKEVERFEAAGRAARYDVLRARVQLANLEPQLIQARGDRELALLDLKRLTNLPLNAPLVLTTRIDAAVVEAAASAVLASDG